MSAFPSSETLLRTRALVHEHLSVSLELPLSPRWNLRMIVLLWECLLCYESVCVVRSLQTEGFPPPSGSGHLSRCPQVCRGLATWRCWDPAFWPCLRVPRSSTCTTCRIWWVNRWLSSLFTGRWRLMFCELVWLSEYSRGPTETRRAPNGTAGTQTARGSYSRTEGGGVKVGWRHKPPVTSLTVTLTQGWGWAPETGGAEITWTIPDFFCAANNNKICVVIIVNHFKLLNKCLI